jgi:MFS family permease
LNFRNTVRRATTRITDRLVEFRGFTPTDRNLYYMCVEIIPIGIAMGAIAFNGPLVLALGGSNALLGAMSSLPALMIILFTFPAARFMDGIHDVARRKRWIVGSLALSRMSYLLIAIAPLVLPPAWAAIAIVAVVVLQSVPLALFNTAWAVVIADICPPNRRSTLFATRLMLVSASMAIGSFLSGLFLDAVPFPINYQLLNIISFVLAQGSTWYILKIQFPEIAAASTQTMSTGNSNRFVLHEQIGRLRAFVHEHRSYSYFNIVTLICWIGAWGAAPIYTIYFVKELQLSNSWIGLNSTLAQIAMVLSAQLWTRLVARKGDFWVVLRTVLLTGLYPLLIVLLPWPSAILAFGFLNTLNDTGLGITHAGLFYAIIPPEKRNSFVAFYSILMNVGAMLAPLAAAPLADWASAATVLLICAAFRFGGGILFWIFPPKPPLDKVESNSG